MEPNLLRDRDGKPLFAILPYDDYQRLLLAAEDLADNAAYLAHKDDEKIPAAFAERLIDGENPVRVWRQYRQLTQTALAARVDDPHYRIRLDDVGTFVWKACDGRTPIALIAERLREQFGSSVEPAEQRLSRFVGQMRRSKLLTRGDEVTPPGTGS